MIKDHLRFIYSEICVRYRESRENGSGEDVTHINNLVLALRAVWPTQMDEIQNRK